MKKHFISAAVSHHGTHHGRRGSALMIFRVECRKMK